jgi:DNA polymerase-1
MKLGWEPTTHTEGGQPKIDEPILMDLAEQFPAATKLVRYLMLDKRLGQLADGKNAWLNLVKDDGRIHASYNPYGHRDGARCALQPQHRSGACAQGPQGTTAAIRRRVSRTVLRPPDWGVQIGADMERPGASLPRALPDPVRQGEYGRLVLNGDVHTFNQKPLACRPRQREDLHLRVALRRRQREDRQDRRQVGQVGKRLSEAFLAKVPAVAQLKKP